MNLSKFLSSKSISSKIVAKFCPIKMAFVLSIIKQNFPLPDSQQEGTCNVNIIWKIWENVKNLTFSFRNDILSL